MARSRRALLAALTAAIAGCSGDRTGSPTLSTPSDAGTSSPTESPTESPTASPTATDTEPERIALDDDRLRWRVDFPGERITEPTAADGQLFVATGSSLSGTPVHGEESAGHLTALSLPGGRIEWHRSLGDSPTSRVHAHRGALYLSIGQSTGLHGVGQRLARFGLDGTERWQSPSRDSFLQLYGFTANRAYLGTGDDYLQSSGETTFAVDLETGTEQWTVEGGDAYGGRVVGETLYADYAGSVVASISTADGSAHWRRSVEALHSYEQSFPLAAGHLFAAIEEGDSYGIAGIDAADGTTSWTHGLDTSSPFVVTSATAVGEAVVATEYDGLLFARDAATGEKRWSRQFDGRVRAPLPSDGMLYCSVLDGPVVAVDAESGSKLWQTGGSKGYSGLSVAGETLLVVRSGDGEIVVEARRVSDGGLRWSRTIPGALHGFERAGRTLVVTTDSQSIYGVAL